MYLLGIERPDIETPSFRCSQCKKQKMTAIRQELGEAVTRVSGQFHGRCCDHLTPTGAGSVYGSGTGLGIQDHPVTVPCAPVRDRCSRQRLDEPCADINPLQLAACEEANGPAVRRPKRPRAVFRSGESLCRIGFQQAQPELTSGLKNEFAAIRG